MTTKRLVIIAFSIALYVVLCLYNINLGNIVISLAGLPVVIAGLLFGPTDGFLVGFLGCFVDQMLKYGFTATTILWILPPAIRGLIVGFYAKKKKFELNQWQTVMIMIVSSLVVTVLNTVVMYVDAKVYGYYTYAYVFGATVVRVLSSIATALVFSIITYPLMKRLQSIRK